MPSSKNSVNNEGILVYIESFNKQAGTVLMDFIDSNEFNAFNSRLNFNNNVGNASMILVKNYFQKKIQENTIYLIKNETIDLLFQKQSINFGNNNIDSFVIGYEITLDTSIENLFKKSIYMSQLDLFLKGIRSFRTSNINELSISVKGNVKANIRNVGQGNWNELITDNLTSIVFDIGAPINAKKEEVLLIINNREFIYQENKPILLISHWDIDHYHALVAMEDKTLASFSYVIFRDYRPTLTSRIIFGRFERNLERNKIISLSSEPKVKGKAILKLLSPENSQILIFNASEHKDRNRNGIVLLIRTANSSIIFSGDVYYYQLSEYVLNHINYDHNHYLVVPHHGGNAGKFIYELKQAKPNDAIISVGTNTYKHPSQQNRDKLREMGFKKIKLTSEIKDIEVNL